MYANMILSSAEHKRRYFDKYR